MKKLVIILTAIVILAVAFVVIGETDNASASDNYMWALPLVYKNYIPNQYGCTDPDSASCVYGPPFSTP